MFRTLMDSERQTLITLGPYFQMYTPYYNLLGDLHFSMSLLLFSALFSAIFFYCFNQLSHANLSRGLEFDGMGTINSAEYRWRCEGDP